MVSEIREQNKAQNLSEGNPELASQWHPSFNGTLRAADVSCNSHKRVWWLGKCGHEWIAEIKSRNHGRGCPYCSGREVLKGFNDLATTNKEYLKEWDYKKNIDVTPYELSSGSHKKVWWKCQRCGQEWQASPNNRISKKRDCPYCCHNPILLKGVNDLETLYPELVREWNYERNDLLPSDVTGHSPKRVWWKCDKGHEWQTTVNHRANGSKCPYCSKGMQTSFPEQAIFFYIKKAFPDAENKYKEIFGSRRFELDVFVPSMNLGIEYDGEAYHYSERQRKRDLEKYLYCKSKFIQLIRVVENVNFSEENADYVIHRETSLEDAINDLLLYVGANLKANISKDGDAIRNNYLSYLNENSLFIVNPSLCEEWNYEKNSTTPEMYLSGSNVKVWWKCKKGHEWEAQIYERNKGKGCPYCANVKILSGFNDLATKRPDLIVEWDFERNKYLGLDPSKVFPGSGKKAWWKCTKCGHEWLAEISSRNKGHGCPKCNVGRPYNKFNIKKEPK